MVSKHWSGTLWRKKEPGKVEDSATSTTLGEGSPEEGSIIADMSTKITQMLNRNSRTMSPDPGAATIDIKLNGNNYDLWFQVVDMYFSGKDKLWYINGNKVESSPEWKQGWGFDERGREDASTLGEGHNVCGCGVQVWIEGYKVVPYHIFPIGSLWPSFHMYGEYVIRVKLNSSSKHHSYSLTAHHTVSIKP